MASEAAVPAGARPEKARLVYPTLGIPFVLLLLCFAAWGAAANLTDVLVGVFRTIFDMSNFQSALVQFAYYGAYFSLAIPAALIEALAEAARGGKQPSGFLDTGVELITNDPVDGVKSDDEAFGVRNCWG